MAAAGPGEVLAMIRSGEVATRRDIQDSTGLSRVTVAQRVDALLRGGLVREAGSERSTGGRRPARLEFDEQHRVAVVADLDTTHSRVAVTDLAGTVLAERTLPVHVVDGPEAVLGQVEATFRELLAVAGRAEGEVAGIGISVPGPVDPHTSRPSQPPIMPGWDAYPIAEHLRSTVDVPVVVENDANAMAVGEHAAGVGGGPATRAGSRSAAPLYSAMCLVKVSTGIGTGIVIDGRVYRGIDGGAGDIGHMRIPGAGDELCMCGSHGCLAAVASGGAIARRLVELGVPASSGSDTGRLLADGHPDAVRLTREAGRLIGEVMAAVVCLLNPGVLVVAGDLASSPLLTGLREGLYPRSLPRATRNLEVRLSLLGRDAALVGLARLVVDEVFSPAALDAALGW